MDTRIPRLLLSILGSALLLWLLTRSLDWQATMTAMSGIQWRYVPLLALVWAIPLLTRTLLWQALLNWRLRFLPTFHCLNIGFLVNNTLPLRAGDVARALLISRTTTGVSAWSVLGSIVIERILDILAVLLILAGVLFFLPVQSEIVLIGAVIAAGALTILIGLILMARFPQAMQKILTWFFDRLPFLAKFGLVDKYEKAIVGVQALTTWRGLRDVFFWASVTWFFSLLGAWLLILIFPNFANTPHMIEAISLALVGISLSTVIPLTIANVGAFEGAVIFALATVGIAREEALAFGLIWHVAVILTYAFWGTFSLLVGQFTLADFQRAGAAQTHEAAAD